MRDALVIAGVIAFFVLGAAYIALCARILADTGDIDEPNADETDETDETLDHEVEGGHRVSR
jgi:hypothetical protein